MEKYSTRINSDISQEEWSQFVFNHPQGNIFQTPGMFSVYLEASHNKPVSIAVFSGGRMKGLLLSVIITNGGVLARWATARSIIIGGPLVENDDPGITSILIEEYVKALPKYVIYSEIRPVYSLQNLEAALLSSSFKREGHYNLFLDIHHDPQVLWEHLHKERRRNILQAQNKGLQFREVTSNEEIKRVSELIDLTYKRKKVPLSYLDIFESLQETLGDQVHFFAAFLDNEMIAGQVRLCYKNLVYAWFAGSNDEYFKFRPNDFLMWNVICWSHKRGYSVFDFGGGGKPGVPYGVRDYKLKYGCEMEDWGRFVRIHKPFLYKVGTLGVKMLGMKK